MGKRERNYSYDIIRIFALFSVISVHFFLNSGFYKELVFGREMLIMTTMRSFFMICVPLFLMLSGALVYRKTLEKRYYTGIISIVAVYLLASIACAVYRISVRGDEFTAASAVLETLQFNMAPYGWYVEMYIGLFLLIPFLNLMYNTLGTKKRKLALVATLVVITALPTVINIHPVEIGAHTYSKFVGDWWYLLYPVSYYIIGAFLGEYKPKLRRIPCLLLIVTVTAVYGYYMYYRSKNEWFIGGFLSEHRSLPVMVLSVLVFIFISGFDLSSAPRPVRKVLSELSGCCYGAYLVSFIFDDMFYKTLDERVPNMTDKLNFFPHTVLSVFVCSLLLSYLINIVYRLLGFAARTFIRKLRKPSC